MDGRERQRHVLVDDGAQENGGGKNPHQGAQARSGSTIDDSEARNEVREHEAATRPCVTTNSIAHAGVAVFDAVEGSAPLSSSIAPLKTVYHATLATDAASAAAAILR